MECPNCDKDFETQVIFNIETPHVIGRDDFVVSTQCPHCAAELDVTYPDMWANADVVGV